MMKIRMKSYSIIKIVEISICMYDFDVDRKK